MQTAVGESTYPVMGAIKWMQDLPRDAGDPAAACATCSSATCSTSRVRVLIGSTMLPRGDGRVRGGRSPLGLLTLPAALLAGLAFAAPGRRPTRRPVENDSGFAVLFRFVIVPLFLFGGVFFPVTQLPLVLERWRTLTPLWHGVALSRDARARRPRPWAARLLHVAYLAVWVVVGFALAVRSYQRRLAV